MEHELKNLEDRVDKLEEKLDDIQVSLVENTQLDLYSGHGYVTGNLSDSIKSDYTLDGLTGNVRGYIDEGTAPYGVYVDQGHELRDKGADHRRRERGRRVYVYGSGLCELYHRSC